MSICALCKQEKELKNSHIIPRFVSKWLKDTSATGLLRGVVEPDERIQDFRRIPLLCGDCENRLSDLETYFASEFFYPYLKTKAKNFKYDIRLVKFVISLSWRTLLTGYEGFKQDFPNLKVHVDAAERNWRMCLLGKSEDLGLYEHHLFFFDYLAQNENMPDGFQWYTLRAVDMTLAGNKEKAIAYSKFPWMMFVSSICPTKLDGWIGTKINIAGELAQPQYIEDSLFNRFLLDRSKSILSTQAINKNDPRILKTIKRKPKNFLKSQSLEVSLAEAKRMRDFRKKSLPPVIEELIGVLENALECADLTDEQKLSQKFGLSLVSDAISRISIYKAIEFQSSVEWIIKKAKLSSNDTKCYVETNEMVIVFMINLYSTQEEQLSKVMAELDELVQNNDKNNKKYMVVFSYNPFEIDLPYQSGFFIS